MQVPLPQRVQSLGVIPPGACRAHIKSTPVDLALSPYLHPVKLQLMES